MQNYPVSKWLWKAMSIFSLQISVILITCSFALAHTNYAQEVLDREVTLNLHDVTLREALRQIESTAQVKFVYSSHQLNLDTQVTILASQKKLKMVLRELLEPLSIDYYSDETELVTLRHVRRKRFIKKTSEGMESTEQDHPYESPSITLQESIDIRLVIITGKVTSSDAAEELAGVNIVVKGTSQGVITDINGNFKIEVPSEEAILVFSFVGFKSEEVRVGSRTVLDIVLTPDILSLGEVVVTALGIEKESSKIGYAMTELTGEDVTKTGTVNPINGLQGKVAGVQIDMGSSGPQSSQRILIRGNSSMSGNNQPIFVVDGTIIDNETTSTGTRTDRDFGNDLKNLNSDDFETISVLKGAAATALYGSRASNGVILITTKKGKKGDGLGISFSHAQQFESVYAVPELQNEFGEGLTTAWDLDAAGNETRNVTAGVRNFGPRFDGLPYTVNGGSYSGTFAAQRNNLKDFYKTGHFANTNVALSNGSEKGTFRFSYSNLQSSGITPNNGFNRNSFSINTSHDISKRISAIGGFSYVNSEASNPTYQGESYSPIFDFLYTVPREYDLTYWKSNYQSVNNDGYNANDPWGYSKILYDYYENDQTQKEDNFRSNLNVNFKLTDWLKLTAKGDIYKLFTTNETKTLSTGTSDYAGAGYSIYTNRKDQYRMTAMLSADKAWSDLRLGGFFAVERWDTKESNYQASTNNGLLVPGVFNLSNSASVVSTEAWTAINRKRINSVYGLVNLEWKYQVFLDVTGRNDWSSSMVYSDGSGDASYFYPSVSISWLLNETFADKVPNFISLLKLRASYAVVGKDANPYTITTPGTFKYSGQATDNRFDGNDFAYYEFANSQLGGKNIKPEKQHSIEFGTDIRFFNNRLGVDVAYYKNNTKNQILALRAAEESGVESRLINAGNIQNEGIELLVTGTPFQSKDFEWDLALNASRNRNKIIELTEGVEVYQLNGGGGETNAYATAGGAYGDIYTTQAYTLDGKGNKVMTGDGVFVQSGTSTKVGSIQPDLLAGLTSTLRWKNFSLNGTIDSRWGGDIYSLSYNYGMYSGTLASSLKGRTQEYGGLPRTLQDGRTVHDGIIPDGVFEEGTTAADGTDLSGRTYQWAYENGYKQPVSASNHYSNLYSWSSGIREEAIFNCSWVMLREVSLYWTVPSNLLPSGFIKSASLGIGARNVGFLYTSLPDGINPEGLATTYGSEYKEGGGSPLSRTYCLKINVTF